MGYIRAEDVLPSEVLTLVQEFIDGQTLYVPKKDAARNTWGSVSGAREYLAYRNAQIRIEYRAGSSVHLLAEKYCLSEKSIQRIIRDSNPLK
ncbi:MAG: hypothetical protein HFI10_08155 [Lachnospiraceae bacterium]|nr:hypothetical protein [Lachnospiraceae bacterium]